MKKKCYIYTRVSTTAQVDGYSLDAQKEELYRYAEYNNLEIAGEYCDAGISGGSIKGRHDFQRMIQDVISGMDPISYVLVFKLSRFGRNAADVLKTVQLLQDYDVNLVSVNEGIDSSTSGGKLMLSILSAVAEIEKENIAVQFAAGRLQKFKNGGWAGGPIPYGYKKDGNKLVTVDAEAYIVKKIFELYVDKENGINTVIRYLNDHGYKNRKGKPFVRDIVVSILSNPFYCGDMYYNRRSNNKNAKPKEVIHAKGSHEPIISGELYGRVREKLDDKSKAVERVQDPERISILSGLVKCPVCGSGMVAIYSRKKSRYTGEYDKGINAYMCPNHRKSRGRTCEYNKQLNQNLIDAAVYEYIKRVRHLTSFTTYIENSLVHSKEQEQMDDMVKALRKQYYSTESLKDKMNKEIDSLDVQSEGYDGDYERLSKQVDSLYDKLDELEEKIEEANRKRRELDAAQITCDKVFSALEHFGDVFDRMSYKEKREFMRLLIDKIEVFKERREDGKLIRAITFKFPVYKVGRNGEVQQVIDQSVGYRMRCDSIGRTASESKTSYPKIKQFIFDKHQVKVSSLYIAQVKRKYGIIERKNYNTTQKGDDFRQPKCPEYKEALIVEALKHFKMIENEVIAL